MLMASSAVIDGAMTIGDFVMVNTYLLQLYQPLNLLGSTYRMIKTAIIDMEQMFSLMREVPEVRHAVPLRVLCHHILTHKCTSGPRRPRCRAVGMPRQSWNWVQKRCIQLRAESARVEGCLVHRAARQQVCHRRGYWRRQKHDESIVVQILRRFWRCHYHQRSRHF